MRASIGIPSVFTPVVVSGRLLADGGLLNPVPVDALLGNPADRTIAVSLSGRRTGDTTSSRPVTESAETETVLSELSGLLRRNVLESDALRHARDWWAERFASTPAVAPVSGDFDFDELPKGLRTADVVSLSLETTEAIITRFRMAASPPTCWSSSPGHRLHLRLPSGISKETPVCLHNSSKRP